MGHGGVRVGDVEERDPASAKASLKPNGQTKDIAGQKADGYDLDISMNAATGGDNDMKMTMTLAGPIWIVKNAPGSAEYAGFYKAAVVKGADLLRPPRREGTTRTARAMAEMYRQFAEIGGIAYQSDVQIKMGGSGPMASFLATLGNVTMSTVVNGVETGTLADDLFTPPAGYKLNARK